MLDIFSTAKIEKQICELHVKKLEVLQIHNQIRSDIFEFLTDFRRLKYPDPKFQIAIDKAYSEVIEHNTEVKKRIDSVIKYLKNYGSRF